MNLPRPLQRHDEQWLDQLLRASLGELEAPARSLLREHLDWVELEGGDALVRQGDPGDAMYISVSGRLRVSTCDESGRTTVIRELSRGQIIGEMSLLTGEPRSATVMAVRASVLLRLDKAGFELLTERSPRMSMAIVRQLIQRLRSPQPGALQSRPVMIGVLPVSDGVDVQAFAANLAAGLTRFGRVQVVDGAAAERELATPGGALDGGQDADAHARRHVATWLDGIEAANDFVLLVGDAAPTAWTRHCARHADELLLVADATQPPVLHAIERELLSDRAAGTAVSEILVLLHPASTHIPRATAAWLARRPLTDHLHVRLGHEGDMARLVRIQARAAVGLVLGGGGARGFAHLGVMRALHERGIVVDCLGGTSIGSFMGVLAASDQPLDQVAAVARKAFSLNPTADINPLPVLSLIRGQRLRRIAERTVQALFSAEIDLEDLWRPFYCVATNYSQACEAVLRRGPLIESVLASTSIPVALPPVVIDGDLHCDGGLFNNVPVDVMRAQRGVRWVIGVDVGTKRERQSGLERMPAPLTLAVDRMRPAKRRRFRLPSLGAYLLNITILHSASRVSQARAISDLHMEPPLDDVGVLDWRSLQRAFQSGYEHASEVLDALPAAELDRLRPSAPGVQDRPA